LNLAQVTQCHATPLRTSLTEGPEHELLDTVRAVTSRRKEQDRAIRLFENRSAPDLQTATVGANTAGDSDDNVRPQNLPFEHSLDEYHVVGGGSTSRRRRCHRDDTRFHDDGSLLNERLVRHRNIARRQDGRGRNEEYSQCDRSHG